MSDIMAVLKTQEELYMNQKQMEAAKKSMVQWLAHPQELGKEPSKIECAGEFDLHDLHYYIFKYKKGMFGKYLIGVCGGFEGEELEHCGHVISQMQEYNESTAEKDAIEMVEFVRQYWMERAEQAEKRKNNPGTFLNFVLLKENKWDKEAFLKQLKEDWQIEDESHDDKEKEDSEDMVVISYKEASIISVALMPAPIPDGEAEYHAQSNYMWKDAVETVKQHKAHLLVTVMGKGAPVGEILVKVIVSLCRQGGVLGIYANETVYQPELYMDFAKVLDEGGFPVFNLVWIGLYKGENGMCCYTCGMNNFGYDEMEVIDSSAESNELFGFMADIADYVINENVTLKDGETIGFTEEQKLPISKSTGVAVEGESLKIRFP